VLNQLGPYPESFGAGIDGRPHFKPIVLVEEYPVEDVALSSSVLSDHCDYGDVLILIGFVEPIDGLLVYDDF
jgi:hypothetical protein